MSLTLEAFRRAVEGSEVVSLRLLDDFWRHLPADSEPQSAAAELVQAGLLTDWQCRKILKGRSKGFVLGKYVLLDRLGSGGMSNVYLAEHRDMRRRVAIKVLPKSRADNPAYVKRFRTEAQAAAALDHPHVVRAFDFSCEEDGPPYLVMEYVQGRNLEQLVQEQGSPAPEVAADYIRQAALGLHAAHLAGMVHRDVKPANLHCDADGLVKVLDLGLARFVDMNEASTHDGRRHVVGTADFLAPEQAHDSRGVDARADIYSLGCTLYYLLTGRLPFPKGSVAERLVQHQKAQPKPIAALRPAVPQSLICICERMMAKKPDQRFQSMAAVVREIETWLAASEVAAPTSDSSDATEITVVEDVAPPIHAAPPVPIVPPPPPPRRRQSPSSQLSGSSSLPAPADLNSAKSSPAALPTSRFEVQPRGTAFRSRRAKFPAVLWVLVLLLLVICGALALRVMELI